jgi:hypothetical protein
VACRSRRAKKKPTTLTVKGPFPRSRLQMRFRGGGIAISIRRRGLSSKSVHGGSGGCQAVLLVETRHLNRRIGRLADYLDRRPPRLLGWQAIPRHQRLPQGGTPLMQLRYRSTRNKVQGACRWPTIRTQTKSNRAKRSLGSTITIPATCPRKPSTVANRNPSSEQILTG